MRIIVAGDWSFDIYQKALADALAECGHVAIPFSYSAYFRPSLTSSFPTISAGILRAQHKFALGPTVLRANAALLRLVQDEQPDALIVWTRFVSTRVMKRLREVAPSTLLVSYTNDDPFSPLQLPFRWRHFANALHLVNLALAYRPANVDDFRRRGAERVELFPPWYNGEIHRPSHLGDDKQLCFSCDAAFIGHFEPDGRREMLEEIVRSGITLRLFGTGWDENIQKHSVLASQKPILPLKGDDYIAALCATKVALCFLSKLNRDVYTRRCFEIPATGTMMLAEYSDEMPKLFVEGVEAEFFRSHEELISKLKYYLANDALRNRIAQAGRRRVEADGHDVVSRAAQLVTWIEAIKMESATGRTH